MPVFKQVNVDEATASLEFEVYCSCGEGICNNTSVRASRFRSMPQIVVSPCEACLEKAREEGYEKGFDNACETNH